MRRYPKYKDSGVEWIGEVPDNWEVIRLGDLGVFSSSGIDKKLDENEERVRMVNYTDIIQNRKYLDIQDSKKDYMVVTTPLSKLLEHRLKKGDLVFIPSSETQQDLGYSSLIDFEESDIVFSYHIIRFQFKREVYHYFKKYLSNYHLVLNQFSIESKGTTRQIIGRNVFRNIKVILPPIQEQQQIVTYLDQKISIIDQIIFNSQKKINILKEQRTSTINHIVTKGLNPNVRMKDSGVEWIGEIPEGWEVRPLKMITDVRPSNVDKHIYPEEIQVDLCNYTDVYKNEFVGLKTPLKQGSCNKTEYSRFNLKKGDVIITKDSESPNDIGIPCLIIDDLPNVVCGYHLTLLRPTDIDGGFLYCVFQTQHIKSYFETESNGITRYSLGKSSIESTSIVFPPFQEQQQIVSYLDQKTKEIDDLIVSEQKRIELMKEYRQSLISEVVTGKIKVTK